MVQKELTVIYIINHANNEVRVTTYILSTMHIHAHVCTRRILRTAQKVPGAKSGTPSPIPRPSGCRLVSLREGDYPRLPVL